MVSPAVQWLEDRFDHIWIHAGHITEQNGMRYYWVWKGWLYEREYVPEDYTVTRPIILIKDDESGDWEGSFD